MCNINRVYTIALPCDEFDFVQIFAFQNIMFGCYQHHDLFSIVWCNDKLHEEEKRKFLFFSAETCKYTFHVNKFTSKYFVVTTLYLHVVWKNWNISCYCYGFFIFFSSSSPMLLCYYDPLLTTLGQYHVSNFWECHVTFSALFVFFQFWPRNLTSSVIFASSLLFI